MQNKTSAKVSQIVKKKCPLIEQNLDCTFIITAPKSGGVLNKKYLESKK